MTSGCLHITTLPWVTWFRSSDADTSILSGQFSDVSASSATIKPTSGLEHLAFLIPCETNDDVNELEEAMKDCASRQWMVRSDTYSGSILLNVLLNNTLIIYILGHIMKISDIGNAMAVKISNCILTDQPYSGGGTHGSWRNNSASHKQTTEQGQETEHQLDRRARQNWVSHEKLHFRNY